jgi:hypothetical protein
MDFGVNMARMVAAARNRGRTIGQIMLETKTTCKKRCKKVDESHELLRSGEILPTSRFKEQVTKRVIL